MLRIKYIKEILFYFSVYSCLCVINTLNFNKNNVSNEQDILQIYEDYIQYYNKQESISSFDNFKINFKIIQDFNNDPNNISKQGLNQFTDLSLDQVFQTHFGIILPSNNNTNKSNAIFNKTNKFTDSNNSNYTPIDWRQSNIFNDPRDQGSCGACYAFASLGTIEALINLQNNIKPDNNYLSIQQIIDCDSLEKGCKGGWPSMAYNYILKNGIHYENDYPYEAKNDKCKLKSITGDIVKIDKVLSCEDDECNVNDFLNNLLKNGPYTSVIDAYHSSFVNYKSGYYSADCGEPNHAIVVVGYGYDDQLKINYYIIRNSWGKDWGMNGYAYVKVDKKNYNSCNLGSYGFQPVITKSEIQKVILE